jgi:hypothetical protein
MCDTTMSDPKSTGWEPMSCEIEYCIAHDNLFAGGSRGIYLSHMDNVIIENCTYYRSDYYFWLGADAEPCHWWEGVRDAG